MAIGIDRPRLSIPERVTHRDLARLIPVSKVAEERATSTLLACLMAVDAFAKQLFSLAGIDLGKRYALDCYTEVAFKGANLPKGARPDGLIVLNTGQITRTFLVETKTKRHNLDEEQLLRYVDMARELGLDGLITISNQFAAVPTHHPVPLPKSKVGNLQLFHWSWGAIVAEAKLLAENKEVSDPEQAYILNELLRFLDADRDIVRPFDSMAPGWDSLCEKVNLNQKILKKDEDANETVNNWHELVRALSLDLSNRIARNVRTVLRRGELSKPLKRFDNDLNRLVRNNQLTAAFDIPDAAGRLELVVDLRNRTLQAAMDVAAPQDKAKPATSIRWLLRQLKDAPAQSIIQATWPGRTANTLAPLAEVREDEKRLIPENCSTLPVSFRVILHKDLGRNFRMRKKFVEATEGFLPEYYKQIGQHLTSWTAPPPKVREQPEDGQEDESQVLVN